MSFGHSLREEREERGVSLEAVAEATKVSVRHLHALESDDTANLPGGVFNRGYVQSCCRFLGLDEVAWMERYDRECASPEPDWSEFAEAVKRNRIPSKSSHGRRWLGVLVMLLALGGVAWAAWHFVIRPRVGRAAPVIPQQASVLQAGERGRVDGAVRGAAGGRVLGCGLA